MTFLDEHTSFLWHKLKRDAIEYVLLTSLRDVADQDTTYVMLAPNIGSGIDVENQVPICYTTDWKWLWDSDGSHRYCIGLVSAHME